LVEIKVSPSTIWRWIDNGTLPAYRVGRKGVRLKKAELEASLTPLHSRPEEGRAMASVEQRAMKPLTKQEQQRGLRTLARMQQLRAQIAAKYGTRSPASRELLDQSRDERTAELTRDQEQ